jgi:LuxR family maltose regulon positive regulatory protein
VSLDEDDNDDRRFWAAVLAALRAHPATSSRGALRDLALPAVPSRDPDFLPTLLDALHDLPGSVRLVRDRPSAVQIVLAARSDPPVRLDRLRLTGALLEVRSEALAFSLDEASALMGAIAVGVRPGPR